MPKKMLIDASHAEETRVVVVDGHKVEEFDFESENKRQLAGNIYLAKVTRVEPSLQAAFIDYGGNRHGFLAFSEIHPDYYQIPVADREALLAEEAEFARQQAEEEEKPKIKNRRRKSRKPVAADASADALISEDAPSSDIDGMDVIESDGNEGPDINEPVGFGSPAENSAQDVRANEHGTVADTQDDDGDNDQPEISATDKDDSIESVAQEDDVEEIRPRRKPRPRRYKIQEVIKVRQILLIQVVKEERGNKGAALTTFLSLAGRYCVLMPNTARGGGISRKITNASDRKRLKEIAGDIIVPQGAGLIVRTAGAKRTKSEIKRDYDYLLRQWEQVRELTLKSIAPAPIYEEGSLIKRSIRDLYNREIDEVIIEGDNGYKLAKDYMKMLMPSHAKNIKHYTDPLPLFARHQVESYLSGMFNPTVQLKSGGYIVIGVTEALVAIDVNSGRATKESSIEDTATKTNLEAAEEVARQLRLRDLAGLIVIDFIDMEDRRNNIAVEKRIKDKLKTDRARIQVGRISGFGLMEMSRQRLRPGMIEATTAPCPHCHGTGLTRSDDNLSLAILRELEEEGVRRRSREVLVTVPIAIANYLLNQKREHIASVESRYGLSIRIEASGAMISPEYKIEKLKTATRRVPEATVDVVSLESALADMESNDTPVEEAVEPDAAPAKKKRRRRRRGRGGGERRQDNGNEENGAQDQDAPAASEATNLTAAAVDGEQSAAPVTTETIEPDKDEKKPVKKRAPRKRAPKKAETVEAAEPEAPVAAEAPDGEDKPKKRVRKLTKKAETPVPTAPVEVPQTVTETAAETAPASEPAMAGAEAAPAAASKPKRRGWWSRG